MAEEKLNQKMEANKENRTALMAAMNEKFKEKVSVEVKSELVDLFFITTMFEFNPFDCSLTGQEVGRGAKEQGNQRRH